ncbi:uncharacterized protein BcabD6B2_35240 [Babesia caballi]|uniref:Membrane protein, putative n=1 Tax=Babesia caballi TaxID=5871 RepID=A0AAV4LVJ8_BABCB|nr:membrane protein, putative [Babesia caballi]
MKLIQIPTCLAIILAPYWILYNKTPLKHNFNNGGLALRSFGYYVLSNCVRVLAIASGVPELLGNYVLSEDIVMALLNSALYLGLLLPLKGKARVVPAGKSRTDNFRGREGGTAGGPQRPLLLRGAAEQLPRAGVDRVRRAALHVAAQATEPSRARGHDRRRNRRRPSHVNVGGGGQRRGIRTQAQHAEGWGRHSQGLCIPRDTDGDGPGAGVCSESGLQ